MCFLAYVGVRCDGVSDALSTWVSKTCQLWGQLIPHHGAGLSHEVRNGYGGRREQHISCGVWCEISHLLMINVFVL